MFSFISTQVMYSNDEKKLAYLFRSLDKNGDGTLNREEIEEGYDALGIPVPVSVNDLLKRMESSGNGSIYYHEFLTATQDWSKISQKKELETAFKVYDQGGDGTLSIEELKQAIPELEDTEWVKILNEADTNQDGLISLEELKRYLIINTKS